MMKTHHGQRDQLEKKLVKSLFTGEFDKHELERLKPKGKLTLCTLNQNQTSGLSNKIRIPKSELSFLRKMAAQNGFAINSIKSNKEELEAIFKGLPVDIAEDMLLFIETNTQLDAIESKES